MLTGHSQAVDSPERKLGVISSTRSKTLPKLKADQADTQTQFMMSERTAHLAAQEQMFKTGDFFDLPMAEEDMLSN